MGFCLKHKHVTTMFFGTEIELHLPELDVVC